MLLHCLLYTTITHTYTQLTGLSEDDMKVAELVGVSPAVLSKLATGIAPNMVLLLLLSELFLSRTHSSVCSVGAGMSDLPQVLSKSDDAQTPL